MELYLRFIQQEFPDERVVEQPTVSWEYVGWDPYDPRPLSNCDSEIPKGVKRVNNLKARKESFGGLVYDPMTTAVFKVDHDEFRILKLLCKGVPPLEIADVLGLYSGNVESFLDSLKAYELW